MKATSCFAVIFASLSTHVAATNTIVFINHCPYDIWFWTVGPVTSDLEFEDQDRIRVPGTNGHTVHPMENTKALGAGVTLKVRDFPEYQHAPAGIVQVEYNHEPAKNAIWYDLSVINCDRSAGPEQSSFCPLIGGGIKMHVPGAPKGQCPAAWCSNGECENMYERHGNWQGEPTFKCDSGVDVHVETCTERIGERTFQDDRSRQPPVEPAKPLDPLAISPGGTCGGETGYTCEGSRWGDCCSQYGYCGNTQLYCDSACQAPFGICPGHDYGHETKATPAHTHPSPTSPGPDKSAANCQPPTTIITTKTDTVTKTATEVHTITEVPVTFTTIETAIHTVTEAHATVTETKTVLAAYTPQPYRPGRRRDMYHSH